MNYLGKLSLFIFLFYTQVLPCVAQSSGTSANKLNLAFEHIGPEEGLDAGYNFFIYKDSLGLVWISSIEGLFQFDGLNIKKYTAKEGYEGFLQDDNIQSGFFEDKNGNIWFTTYKHLNVYRRANDDFRYIRLKNELGRELSEGYKAFYLDKFENLWLKVDGLIYTYNILTQKVALIAESKGEVFHVVLDKDEKVRMIIGCPQIRKSGFEIIHQVSENKFINSSFLESFVKEDFLDIRTAIYQQDSIIWLISKSGLLKFDLLKERTKLIKLDGLNAGSWNCGVLIDENHLLLGGQSGLWMYEISSNTFTNQEHRVNTQSYLFKESVYEIIIDQNYQLWVVYENDVKVSFSWINQNEFPIAGKHKETAYKKTNSLLQTPNDKVWTIDEDGEIHKYNLSGRREASLKFEPFFQKKFRNNRLSFGNEKYVFVLGGNSIYKIDVKTDKLELVYESKLESMHFMHAINDEKILFSTSQGIYQLSNKKAIEWSLKPIKLDEGLSQYYQFFVIGRKDIFIPDNKGNLYHLKVDGEEIDFLGSRYINCFVYNVSAGERGDEFLLATDKGIIKWQNTKKKEIEIIHFSTDVKQYGNIDNVFLDQDKNMWFTNTQGLYKWSEEEKLPVKYSYIDGLPSNEFPLYNKILQSSDGKLWIGSYKGVCFFYPDLIKPFPFLPKIQLVELLVNNEAYDFDSRKLTLKYDENSLGFSFLTIGTHLASQNKNFFRLKGYNEEWRKILNGEPVNLNNLYPGEYTLEYFAETANNLTTPVKTLIIHIGKPYWQKWWFALLCTGLFMLLVFSVIRLYVFRKLKKIKQLNERQLAVQKERNRIASELHDDLGAGLSVIKFLSANDLVNERSTQSEKKIERINQSATDLLEKMSDIIWAMNAEHDNLKSLIYYLYQYVSDYLEIIEVEYTVEIPREISSIQISGTKRRQLVLVVKELLRNIAKHANATKVIFKIEVENELLRLHLQDDGVGFDSEEKTLGNGLRNIKNRLGKLNGSIQFKSVVGTSICISVPLLIKK